MKAIEQRSAITTVSTVVIGAGQAGLATSYELEQRGVDHVVLERGEVANSWSNERWDSLRLLTPRWQTVLPGYSYRGNDPDGFMDKTELIALLKGYGEQNRIPVYTRTNVLGVYPIEEGYRVVSDRGEWHCRTLVLATGAFNKPSIPSCSTAIPQKIRQISAMDYRNPSQLASGGVLIVGASATGLQLAKELQQAGHPVTIAAGEHVRMPRRYRGHDIFWWMNACGLLDKSLEDVDNIARVRKLPSAQLVGSPDNAELDFNSLTAHGIRLAGRLMAVNNGTAQFSGSLHNICKLADLKMNRLLNTIDEWIECNDLTHDIPAAERFAPTHLPDAPLLSLDLQQEDITNVIWATGFRPDYSWLHVPVLNRKGQLQHDGGIVASPGLYAMGLPFMRRHKSSFIYGVNDDARDICDHLAGYLNANNIDQGAENLRPVACIF